MSGYHASPQSHACIRTTPPGGSRLNKPQCTNNQDIVQSHLRAVGGNSTSGLVARRPLQLQDLRELDRLRRRAGTARWEFVLRELCVVTRACPFCHDLGLFYYRQGNFKPFRSRGRKRPSPCLRHPGIRKTAQGQNHPPNHVAVTADSMRTWPALGMLAKAMAEFEIVSRVRMRR